MSIFWWIPTFFKKNIKLHNTNNHYNYDEQYQKEERYILTSFKKNNGEKDFTTPIMCHQSSRPWLWHHPFYSIPVWDPDLPMIPKSPSISPPVFWERDSLGQLVLDLHKNPKRIFGHRTDLEGHLCDILPNVHKNDSPFHFLFSRGSNLTTYSKNEDILKKMRISLNISSSFLIYPHLWSTISLYPHLF